MKRIPFHYRIFRGAIGKRFVIKHYRGGRVVMTRYPDMSGIIPSEEQKMQRRLFKRATAYAKKVYAKPALREEKRRLFRKPKRLFQALIKEWFAKRREKDFYRQRRINRWQQNYQQNKMEGNGRQKAVGAKQIYGLNRAITLHPPWRNQKSLL